MGSYTGTHGAHKMKQIIGLLLTQKFKYSVININMNVLDHGKYHIFGHLMTEMIFKKIHSK